MRWQKQWRDRERGWVKEKQRPGEGRKKWRPSGMTQHPWRGTLSIPHASLTVTRRRMPDSDRCRTKGAVVYRYVPSLLPSLHPPILCLPLRETGPLPASVKQGAVWLIWMWRHCGGEKEAAWRFVEIEGCGGSEPNKLCWEAVLLFSPSTRWCVACLHLLTCGATLPLLDNLHVSRRILTNNTRQRGGHVCRTWRLVNRRLKCHPLMSQVTSAPSVPLK